MSQSVNTKGKKPTNKPIKDVWSKAISFPENLPVSQRQEEIAKAIADNQVLIIAGETGSGKTTQLPKICLSLGYGEKGLIGHTQPRRLAARTVADRIASELDTPLGDGVGYQVRFNEVVSDNTRIKLMTDGVLLAEFHHDRLLKKYEVIIIDEAHERSLNIDFLLGLLKPLCLKRPELKVIITSATIDLEKFSKHFTLRDKPAPIIEVSGRTYPVETIYKEPSDNDVALVDQITETVEQVIRGEAKGEYKANGDILVFCAGEREIRDAAQALRRAQLPVEILPLYSRLSVGEQNKVFKSAQRRKVVLATNVAETSITVPGIAYVIDPGLARISRYSFRSKIQRLPIEAISQASANQRKGRCGRVANGVCIRLYSQEDFELRAQFTSAEILRSNLASVILKMLRLGVKDINHFDFIDQPDSRLLNDGFKLLQELGAIDANKKLTPVGRQMSDLPVDPKYARILIEANKLGCLRDSLILISGLSIQDPRERPAQKRQAADQAHSALGHTQSDFYSYLHLWQAINNARESLSNAKFKQHCQSQFWSISRIFEWRELFRQLLTQCKQLGWSVEPWAVVELPDNSNGDSNKAKQKALAQQKPAKQSFSKRYEILHRVLLSGLISNVANKSVEEGYIAIRSRQVYLFPGSAQNKIKPKWIMSGEYIETSKVFAHTVAQIKPDWVSDAAKDMCRFSYSNPHYHIRSGAIKAYRKTLLYGLVLRDKELVDYAHINPQESRQIFIQQALVNGAYAPKGIVKGADFVSHNQGLIAEVEKLESKTRKRNLLVDDNAIYDFYAQALPEGILNRHALEKWLAQGENKALLKFNRSHLLQTEVDTAQTSQFPDKMTVLDKEIHIVYQFDPSKQSDGATMVVPISVLAPFPLFIGDWLVPGLLHEKCIALIRTLPKTIRRHFAPASDAIDRVFDKLTPANVPLHEALAEQLFKARGINITAADFYPEKLDAYYHMNYRILDVDGSLVEEGRDLVELKRHYAHAVQTSVHADNAPERLKLEKHNIQAWDFGELQKCCEYQHQGMTVQAYAMLKLRSDKSISLLLHEQEIIAAYHTHHAIIALARQVLASTTNKQSIKYLQKELMRMKSQNKPQASGSLASQLKLAAQQVSIKSEEASLWQDKLINASLAHACFDNDVSEIKTQQAFEQALEHGSQQWVSVAMDFESALLSALKLRDKVLANVNNIKVDTIELDSALEDIKAQVYRLFDSTFLSYTTLGTLKQYPRYLRAIECRIEKLMSGSKAVSDEFSLQTMQKNLDAKIQDVTDNVLGLDYVFLSYPKMQDFHWMLEEWRVSIFAQQLRTRMPVSEKRLTKFWQNEIV